MSDTMADAASPDSPDPLKRDAGRPTPEQPTPESQAWKRRIGYRHRRRSENDAHASANNGGFVAPVTPEHPLVCPRPPVWIDSQPALAQALDVVRQAGTHGYDTEFIGETSYHPSLCLIQVATAGDVFLIDPMLRLDLRGVWDMLADPAQRTIVHAGAQDLEPVLRLRGLPPANVVDTQIAAGFLGLGYPCALRQLVSGMAGVELGKGLTFTRWDRRPLSPMHLHYAADDVRYLPLIAAELDRRLAEAGVAGWAAEECGQLADPANYGFDLDTQVGRVKGAGRQSPRETAMMRELVALRDQAARREDVPPRAMLPDGVVVELCRRPPRELADFEHIRGLPRPFVEAYGQAVLDIAAAVSTQRLPRRRSGRHVSATEAEQAQPLLDQLWAQVNQRCEQRQVAVGLTCSRKELVRLHWWLAGKSDEAEHRVLSGWRAELLGAAIAAHRDRLDGLVG